MATILPSQDTQQSQQPENSEFPVQFSDLHFGFYKSASFVKRILFSFYFAIFIIFITSIIVSPFWDPIGYFPSSVTENNDDNLAYDPYKPSHLVLEDITDDFKSPQSSSFIVAFVSWWFYTVLNVIRLVILSCFNFVTIFMALGFPIYLMQDWYSTFQGLYKATENVSFLNNSTQTNTTRPRLVREMIEDFLKKFVAGSIVGILSIILHLIVSIIMALVFASILTFYAWISGLLYRTFYHLVFLWFAGISIFFLQYDAQRSFYSQLTPTNLVRLFLRFFSFENRIINYVALLQKKYSEDLAHRRDIPPSEASEASEASQDTVSTQSDSGVSSNSSSSPMSTEPVVTTSFSSTSHSFRAKVSLSREEDKKLK